MATSLPQLPISNSPEEAATQAVRDYCGWHIAPCISEDLVLDGNGQSKLFLPTKRLEEVLYLEVDGQNVENFRFSQEGWVTLDCGVFPRKERAVKIGIRHGYHSADPASVIVGNIVARARMSPTGNIVQQRAGTQSVTFATSGGQVMGFGLMQAEKDLLQPYKLEWGPQ